MDFLNGGFNLFTFRGVRVRVGYVFFILLYFIVRLAPDFASQVAIGLALVLSILLHEFGHVLGAWLCRLQVHEVALTGLGGYTAFSPPQTPGSLFVTTLLGPAVNILLIVVFALCIRLVIPLMPVGDASAHLDYFATIMCRLNFLLFCFNMLPFFPMDGGRIAQAVAWPFAGYANAMVIAGMLGTVGGIAVAGLGLGLASIYIPVPEFARTWVWLDNIPLGGDMRDGHPDILMIIIGVQGAMQSFGLYRHGQSLLQTRKR